MMSLNKFSDLHKSQIQLNSHNDSIISSEISEKSVTNLQVVFLTHTDYSYLTSQFVLLDAKTLKWFRFICYVEILIMHIQ